MPTWIRRFASVSIIVANLYFIVVMGIIALVAKRSEWRRSHTVELVAVELTYGVGVFVATRLWSCRRHTNLVFLGISVAANMAYFVRMGSGILPRTTASLLTFSISPWGIVPLANCAAAVCVAVVQKRRRGLAE